jgi:hypothetical protein
MQLPVFARNDVVCAYALAWLSTFAHHPLALLLWLPMAALTVGRWGDPSRDPGRSLRLKGAILASLGTSGAMSGHIVYLGAFTDLGSSGALCAVWLALAIALYSVWYVSILANAWWGTHAA